MMVKWLRIISVRAAVIFLAVFTGGSAYAVNFVQSPPLSSEIRTGVEDVKQAKYLQVPVITWGGDIATILANGNSAVTAADSIFAQKGLQIKLFREDALKIRSVPI